jgi:hypothetical protein
MKVRAFLRNEEGQSLVMLALGFSVLLMLTGLAIDSAVLFRAKRNVQIAADAAAQAGALDWLYNGSTSTAKTAAASIATANGYTDGVNGIHVTINLPTASGPNAGNPGDVEAIVTRNVPLAVMNMKIFGAFELPTMSVGARAVAGAPTAGTACMWLMDPNSTDLYTQGSYDLEMPGCGIYMNSTSSSAVSVTGNGGTLNALFAEAVGGAIGHQTKPTKISTYAAPRKDPWGNIQGPNATTGAGCDYIDTTTTSLSGVYTSPGTGMAGAGKTICFTKGVTLNNATFGAGTLGTTSISQDQVTTGAGTLVFGNSVTISGTVTVYGGTIDIFKGQFNQPSNTLVNVIAPTSGPYNGIAIMEPSSNNQTLQVQKGSNNQVLDGYIYAPGAQVYLQDSGGGLTASGIVADNLSVKTGQITIPSYDAAHPGTTPNRVLALLE